MKLTILALFLFASVSHANPSPRIQCHTIRGLSFAGLYVEVVPNAYSPEGTAYIQEYFGETQEITDVEFKTISGEGIRISGYEKKGVFKLLKSRIDGEDLGWSLSLSLGDTVLENIPMNCKILTEIPAQSPLPF